MPAWAAPADNKLAMARTIRVFLLERDFMCYSLS
jgi:hypothetical protein